MDVSRRDVLRLAGAAAAATALGCGRERDPAAGAATSSATAPAGQTPLGEVGGDAATTLEIGDAQAELVAGTSRYSFGLVGPDGPISGARATVYVGRSAEQPPEMTVEATELTGTGLTGRGVYVAEVPFRTEGEYLVAVVARGPGGASRGGTKVTVAKDSASPIRGERPPAVATPTVKDPRGAKPLCSQRPKPCPMHDVSLDDALRNGKPTVVVFAAPSFCETEFCGPVVTVADEVAREVGARANFIHVEAFVGATTPGTGAMAEPLKRFKFTSEPWLYVMDGKGVVSDRISGAFTTGELRGMLRAAGVS